MSHDPVFLDERLWFPAASQAAASGRRAGLVAVGGDLSVERLVLAYRQGIFPWTDNPLTWWSPQPRAILPLAGFHVSRTLARVLRQGRFTVSFDRSFPAVIEGCAAPAPGRTSTWISPSFLAGYTRLHAVGYAHSVECWQGARLVGGVYGVAVGGLFAGESMFHRVSEASKVALYHLVRRLAERGFGLFDLQMLTPATRQLGGVTIPREEYLRRLARVVDQPVKF